MKKTSIVVCFSVVLTGCMSVKYPEKTAYLLHPRTQATVVATSLPASLTVVPMVANTPYNNTEFIYALSGGTYKNDFYNVFETAPAAMLTHNLVDCLAQSHLFSSVNNASLQLPADYVLRSQLVNLQANYIDHNHPSADIAMTIVLQQGDHVLLNNVYEASTPLTTKSTPALVTAWNTSVATVCSHIVKDVQAQLMPTTTTTTVDVSVSAVPATQVLANVTPPPVVAQPRAEKTIAEEAPEEMIADNSRSFLKLNVDPTQ